MLTYIVCRSHSRHTVLGTVCNQWKHGVSWKISRCYRQEKC